MEQTQTNDHNIQQNKYTDFGLLYTYMFKDKFPHSTQASDRSLNELQLFIESNVNKQNLQMYRQINMWFPSKISNDAIIIIQR